NLHLHTPQDPYILCLTASPANPSYALRIRTLLYSLVKVLSAQIRFECAPEDWEDFAGNVAFQAAHDLSFRLALCDSSFDVFAGAGLVVHPDEDDVVQGGVRLPVAATIESIAVRLSRGCRDRRSPGEGSEVSFTAHSLGIVSGGDK